MFWLPFLFFFRFFTFLSSLLQNLENYSLNCIFDFVEDTCARKFSNLFGSFLAKSYLCHVIDDISVALICSTMISDNSDMTKS